MSTRLEDSNTSREISLSRYFRRYTEKEDLLVLVEGEEDIPFWSMLLVLYSFVRISRQPLPASQSKLSSLAASMITSVSAVAIGEPAR